MAWLRASEAAGRKATVGQLKCPTITAGNLQGTGVAAESCSPAGQRPLAPRLDEGAAEVSSMTPGEHCATRAAQRVSLPVKVPLVSESLSNAYSPLLKCRL